MVFQNYALYPHMTIGENIEFPLVSRGYSKEETKKKVKWASELLKISDSEAPGGMSSRLKPSAASIIQ